MSLFVCVLKDEKRGVLTGLTGRWICVELYVCTERYPFIVYVIYYFEQSCYAKRLDFLSSKAN
jgi:hypothetical protein